MTADVASRSTNVERRGTFASRLSGDRLLALCLILSQLAILTYLSGNRFFALVCCGLAVWGAWTRIRIPLEGMALHLVYAILAITFLLQHMFSPIELPIDSQFIQSSLAQSVAHLLITVQILHFFVSQPSGHLPVWLSGCGAACLSFATNLRVPESTHRSLLWLMAFFLVAFALYAGFSRRRVSGQRSNALRLLVIATALFMAVSAGIGSAWALQRHEQNVEWFLAEYLGYGGRATRTGFTPSGRLQSVTAWKADGGDRVVLRMFADESPGYLRGKVFDLYQGSSRSTSYTAWVSTYTRRPAPIAQTKRNLPAFRPGDKLYEIRNSPEVEHEILDIWPAEHADARLFTPLTASHVAVNEGLVQVDNHHVVTLEDKPNSVPYFVVAGQNAGQVHASLIETEEDIDREGLTSLNDEIDPEVRELADRLTEGCRTSQDKIQAVQQYFLKNYTYKIGLNVPFRTDPVTHFLTKQPPAHCEYFATGTAVLLRLADVPCRYVIGFVATEWNDVGGFWVARNKDAHAWVEAYDDQRQQWVIVESTPASGVPQPRDTAITSQFSDSFRHRVSIWRMRLREYGFLSLFYSLFATIWSIPGLIILLTVLMAMFVRYQPQLFVRKPRERAPEHLVDMHRVLTKFDRQSREHGINRRENETLTQFANRLRSAETDPSWAEAMADCYVLYSDLRYRGQTGSDAIQQLREASSRVPTVTTTESREVVSS